MKRIVTIVVILSALVGCNASEAEMRNAVIKRSGTTKVSKIPDTFYQFVAIKPDGSVWYYKCNSAIGSVAQETVLFAANDEVPKEGGAPQ